MQTNASRGLVSFVWSVSVRVVLGGSLEWGVAYLDAVFELLGVAPEPLPPSARLAIERRVGVALPEAFAELVLTDAWPGTLLFGSDDQPVPREELLSVAIGPSATTGASLLPFLWENQGVCTWAIPLHEGPDPRVLIEVEWMPGWQLACATFSTWLSCRVQDGRMDERIVYAAQAPPISSEMLAALREVFTEAPRTYGFPGHTTYRLRGDATDLLLWAAEDQCDWWIAPHGDPAAALRSIPRVESIASALFSLRPEGEPALKRLRAE